VEDQSVAALPSIGFSDLPHFLEAWNRLLEASDEDTAARLGTMLTVHGIDERALQMLGKRSPRLRLAAITAAGHLREPRAWDQLARSRRPSSPETSFAAARALLRIDRAGALDALSPRSRTLATGRSRAWQACSSSSAHGRHRPAHHDAAAPPAPRARRVVKLARFGEPQRISGVVRGWLGSSTDPDVLMAALACIEDRSDLPWAIGAAGHPEWRVRMAAARALGRVGGRAELPALLELLRDPSGGCATTRLTDSRARGPRPHELDALHEGARDAFAADMLGQALAERRWS
jgi:HEAT repeat protein